MTAHSSLISWLMMIVGCWSAVTARLDADVANDVEYTRDVRPILSKHCYVCHGPDSGSREAGLRLDRADTALAMQESGNIVIVAGDPGQSELMRRVAATDSDDQMPPATTGHRLTAEEIDLLRRWIAEGAKFDDHWSFRPIVRPPIPSVTNRTWIRNPIDCFVLDELEEQGLQASPEASKSTLIRRLYLDLIGLPPSPDEVKTFLDDDRNDAYDRLVDRLFASPHFGERWGRHWLDLAHYADSDGYLSDALRPHAWLYRNWVIEAINCDLPLDQFTIEQLAGDLLPEATLSQKQATGFLRNTLRNNEAGVDLEEYRLKEIVDRVSTIGAGWLGLSLACAECHSHKYDPISQREFYGVFAFFNNANDVDVPLKLPGEQERYLSILSDWDMQSDILRDRVNAAAGEINAEDPSWDIEAWLEAVAVDTKKRTQPQKDLLNRVKKESPDVLRLACEEFEKHFAKKPSPPSTKYMAIESMKEARETYVHVRGDYRNRGELVAPATPAFLPALEVRSDQPDRLDFARWLIDRSNPLTARVVVNQMWAQLFGRGIVASVDNFGAGGDPPTHPELLDCLACELIEGGWSRKRLLKLIVGSSTYRQSAIPRLELEPLDSSNTLFARQSRLRLEAEIVRDAALSASGLLERRIGGPSIRPPQPAYVTSISRNAEWNVTTGSDLYRRGTYILLRRATPYPMLLTFDAPESTIACTRRERSNSPLQALTLLNDPVFFECAQALGQKLATGENPNRNQRIQALFLSCLGREAQPSEIDRINAAYDELFIKLQSDKIAAKEIVEQEAHSASERKNEQGTDGDMVEAATWILMARIVMNLDEFITRE